MKSALPKVLHRAGGHAAHRPRASAAAPLEPQSIGRHCWSSDRTWCGSISAERPDVQLALQEPQLGTGHALLQAEPFLAGKSGHGAAAVRRCAVAAREHASARWSPTTLRTGAAATVLTAVVDRPDGYGRIVGQDGAISAIVEHKDATPSERQSREINSGGLRFRPRAAVRRAPRKSGRRTPRGNTIFPI